MTLQAYGDNNIKLMYLKARVGVAMEALADSLPSYSDIDFLVVYNKK